MAFNFPSNPVNGQVYEAVNGFTYVYRAASDSWLATQPLTDPTSPIAGPPGTIGYTGSQGVVGYTGSSGSMIGANSTGPVVYPPEFVGPIPLSSSTEFLNINPASRIIISVYNLRISDNSGLLLQFGTSSGYLIGPDLYLSSSTSINGLTGVASSVSDNRGFVINHNSNSQFLNITITLTRSGANTWVCTHHGNAASGMGVTSGFTTFSSIVGGGSINLGSNVIDRVRLICRSAGPGAVSPGVIAGGVCRILYDDAGIQGAGPGSGFVGYTGSAGATGAPSNNISWATFSAVLLTGTYIQNGNVITVTMTDHVMATNDSVYLDFINGTANDGFYPITVTSANTYTIQATNSINTSGSVYRYVWLKSGASNNVSSIIYSNTVYRMTFTTPYQTANYAWSGSCKGTGVNPQWIVSATTNCDKTNTYLDFEVGNSANAFNIFPSDVNIIAIGN
jgi:hypothetical protein